MSQAIENLTRLTARLLDRQPHPTLPGWDSVRLTLLEAEPVPDRADLLSQYIGTDLDVAVPTGLLADAPPGATLRFRARLTTNGILAERAPEEFSVQPPQ
ncbi:MAG TPA: hypothetical protein VGP36_24445 [Mycobacteriales bacterium]|jgi:hypothetical protein|nr:hypothetical protein [Mycobacteriales bacterium]